MEKRTLSLKKLSGAVLKNGSREMTGRSRGTRIREALEKILSEEKRSLRIVLDFSGMGSIDFSWADEVVAKMISRLWGGEYGEKFLVLKNLDSSQAENIDVALERKRLAILITGPQGWRIIGSLNNYLIHTLNRVMEKKQLTLRQLSEEEGIGMNTSGTRLLNLYRKRLVARIEGPAMGRDEPHRGRQYIYQSLLS
ncbi:MAG TPA: STAS-like domain-containing protein [Thermodesulfobacteriota bacterium]|nr:STAS-like domain-containing protein [Thermodesulfobacteriota bacterium]